MNRLLIVCTVLLALVACRRESPAPSAPTPADVPPAATRPIAPLLKDVIENDPRFVVGISYPPAAAKYPPALAAELKRYSDAARADLMEALGPAKPASPYSLSISYTESVNTPRFLAIAADGDSYTGGAHGNPVVARFVWLRQQDKLLKAGELIPDARSWRVISDYVREQLHAALSQRVDADELPAAERAEIMRSAGQMIDAGSAPEAASFAQFEPVVGADGKLSALRFVFPPYQVGPYADGTQTVEVPASMLLPHVAPAYRELFQGG